MNRRDVLGVAIGGASLIVATGKVFAEGHQHEHAASGHASLSEAARQCVSSGDACMSYCLQLLAQGDGSLRQKRVPNERNLRSACAARLGQFRTLSRTREDRSRGVHRL